MPTSFTLGTGETVVIDEQDADLIAMGWSRRGKRGYLVCHNDDVRRPRLHRLIVERMIGRELQKTEFVDHVNGKPMDNRRANLRKATMAENNQNKRMSSHNTSGFKGVTWDKSRGVWGSWIKANGVRRYVGRFATKEEAAKAYDAAAKRLHGDFANTNEDLGNYSRAAI